MKGPDWHRPGQVRADRPCPSAVGRRTTVRLAAWLALGSAMLGAPSGALAAAGGASVAPSQIVYVGTRADGPDHGITALRFDPATGHLADLGLVAAVARPTWLTPGPGATLYAVSEVGNDGKTEASVYGFSADAATGRLAQRSKVASGGGGATHLLLDRTAASAVLIVSNYAGQVSVVPVGRDGALAPVSAVRTDVGAGLLPRQSSAHPHGAAVDPTGRFVFVSDLGADRVFVYRLDPSARTLQPAVPPSVALPPGSGPRHIVVHPNGRFVYVNDELTGDVTLLGWDAATQRLGVVKEIATRGPAYQGEISSAELMLSPDGRFLTVSNRGEDVLVVYAIDGATGDLTEVQRLASGGKAPVSFATDPSGHWLLVANEESGTVVVFARDPRTGRLTPSGETLALDRPTNLAFLSMARRSIEQR